MDEEGNVSIRWVDSTVSKVKPQELYKVDTEVKFVLFKLLSFVVDSQCLLCKCI